MFRDLAIATLAVLAASCGRLGFGEQPGASDAGGVDAETSPDAPVVGAFDATGYWVITSAVIEGETLTRANFQNGVRGDATISEVDGEFSSRFIVVADGLPVAAPVGDVGSFLHEQDPDRWVLDADTTVGVYDPVVISADTVELVLVDDDPRTTDGLPTKFRLDRTEPPDETLSESMEVIFMQFPGEAQTGTGDCLVVEDTSVIYTGSIVVEPARLTRTTVNTSRFADTECLDPASESAREVFGLSEESGEFVFSWGVGEGDEVVSSKHQVTVVGGDFQLDLVSCLPSPECEANLFTRVVLRPAVD